MDTLQKERVVHDVLHTHDYPKVKWPYRHVLRCSCGKAMYGHLSKEEFDKNIDRNISFHTESSVVQETEEWVWLGRSQTNLDSNFFKLYQNGRKLWCFSRGNFYPLSSVYTANSTIWKIATRRLVPLSIILENTHPNNIEWVKKNHRKWINVSREPINNAVGKRKRLEEAKIFVEEERIKEIAWKKENAKWLKMHPEWAK